MGKFKVTMVLDLSIAILTICKVLLVSVCTRIIFSRDFEFFVMNSYLFHEQNKKKFCISGRDKSLETSITEVS